MSNYAYALANKQRYIALKNAFDTLRQYVEPSCNPTQMKNFEKLEKYLVKMYKSDVNLTDKILKGEYD
jgi:hypothetical protein